MCLITLIITGCGQDSESTVERPETTVTSNHTLPHDPTPSPQTESPAKQVAEDTSNAVSAERSASSKMQRPRVAKPSVESPRRMADESPEINVARLTAVGIKAYESQRLVLLTDLPAEQVQKLPRLADQLFERLQQHFGTLPPALDGSEFRVVGCLIRDVQRFQSAGLMPNENFTFDHGRHRDYQFWCYAQKSDYYQRHLLLHEFIHCFMTCESGLINIPPLWYIEGMAEYFATHQLATNGRAKFGTMPETFDGYEGWGRVSALDRMYKRNQTTDTNTQRPRGSLPIPPLNEVLRDVTITATDSDYAQWWAVCWMLQNNPAYSEAFAALKQLRTRNEFITKVHQIREQIDDALQADWLLFAESLATGFESSHCFPVHSLSPISLKANSKTRATCQIFANRDWQDTGVRLQSGQSVSVLCCEGKYSINEPADLWTSEPQGVGVEYYRGIPLGAVVATLVDSNGFSLTRRILVGREATITAQNDSSLWLQINDSSSSRSNNSGEVTAVVSLSE